MKESDDQQKVRIKFTLTMKRLNKTSNVLQDCIFPKDVAAVVTSDFSPGKIPLVQLVDTGGGKPLSADWLTPLSGAAVVGELLFQELSVLMAVVVEGLVSFQKRLDFILCQIILFI